MTDEGVKASVIDLGGLAEPAKVLVEKISDGVGGIFRPSQIKRIAKAEAVAELIRVEAEIQVSDAQRAAATRWMNEEVQKQENMVRITEAAIPLLEDDSKPQEL